MANNILISAGPNTKEYIIATQHVPKRIFEEWQIFFAWIQPSLALNIDVQWLEHEWLRLVREPQFQDMRRRSAQAELVIGIATGGIAGRKPLGRLLTMRCLAGVGRLHVWKKCARLVKERKEVENVLGGDSVGMGEYRMVDEEDGIDDAAVTNADLDDEMEIDHGDGNDADEGEMEIDDETDFNDSGLPPSSPEVPSGKTPARFPSAASLPTSDSTPAGPYNSGTSTTAGLGDPNRYIQELERRLQEANVRELWMLAHFREKEYDAEMSDVDHYLSNV